MPWNDNSGNGGSSNEPPKASGGPWGGGPQRPGGGGGGNRPPDLEDILRKGSDRLKNAIPGGGGTGGAPSSLLWGIGGILLIIFWAYSSFYTLDNGILQL